eukprot:jgi/Mesen1/5343/ME000267S04482
MLDARSWTRHADVLVDASIRSSSFGRHGPEGWCLEKWIQNVAESQTRTWISVVDSISSQRHPVTKRKKRSPRNVRAAAVGREAADSKKGTLWLCATMLIYCSPALACLTFVTATKGVFLKALYSWLAAEAAFAVYRVFEHRRVSGMVNTNEVPDPAEVNSLVDEILALGDQIDKEAFLSGWFLGAEFRRIKMDNMREFLAYAFFHRYFAELSAENQAAVEYQIGRVASRWGMRFEAGFDPGLRFMAHTREPLRTLHHPLALYAWGNVVSFLTGCVLRSLGFARHSAQHSLRIWHRPAIAPKVDVTAAAAAAVAAAPAAASAAAPGKQAQVFVHGLGIGVTPYLGFISMLLEDQDHSADTLVVELSHIAMSFTSSIPTVDSLVAGIEQAQQQLGLGPATYMGHSYGSLVVAHLVRTRPHLVAAVGLVDPVCFLLCLPDVVYNFVYRPPAGPTAVRYVCDALRWVFCSKEFQVAQVLCRGFDCYLEKHQVPVIYNASYQHAEFLFRPAVQRLFLQTLRNNSTEAGVFRQA